MKDLLGSDRSTVQPVPPLPIDQRRPQLPTISPLWPPSTPSPHVDPAHTSAFTIPNIKLAKTVFANSSLIKPASAAFIERESRCPCEGLEAATAHQTQTPPSNQPNHLHSQLMTVGCNMSVWKHEAISLFLCLDCYFATAMNLDVSWVDWTMTGWWQWFSRTTKNSSRYLSQISVLAISYWCKGVNVWRGSIEFSKMIANKHTSLFSPSWSAVITKTMKISDRREKPPHYQKTASPKRRSWQTLHWGLLVVLSW